MYGSTHFIPLVAAAALGCSAASLAAQNDRPDGWLDQAELTFVMANGNASATTFGLKNTLDYYWPSAQFRLQAGGVRTSSGTTVRTATGTPGNYVIQETTETETTAENYFLRSRYDRSLSEAAYLFGGGGWTRNTFAGIQNRYNFVSGGGRIWLDGESSRFKTDLGLTYTIQDDVVEDPSKEDSFLGLQFSYDGFRQLTETTQFTSLLTVDENLNETSDLRADWTNALAVAMSDNLALKASLQLLFDNQPSLVGVPIPATGSEIFTELGKTDSVFTVAIVASF